MEMGGAIEDSAKGRQSIIDVMPFTLLTVVTLLFPPALYVAWFRFRHP